MKVGLSGGIACGKSTVLGFFREAGWQTVDSDAVVRELLATDAEVKAQLRSRWGEAVLPTGQLIALLLQSAFSATRAI